MVLWYALCHVGAEQSLIRELTHHGIAGTEFAGGCEFDCTDEQASSFLHHTQVATRLLLAGARGSLEDLDIDAITSLIPPEDTYRVTTTIEAGGESELSSTELSAALGDRIRGRNVDLASPQHVLYAQVATETAVGLDVAGDLSKRYYKIFANARSIKGTLAASVIWRGKATGSLLDPFGNSGEVAIEEALRASGVSPLRYVRHQRIDVLDAWREKWTDDSHDPKTPTYCFDTQLGNLRSARKNAKLAGVEKHISFSKLEADWLDVKFEEGQVGRIITMPPQVTHRHPESDHLVELCHQAQWVLGEKGTLTVVCSTEETSAALRTAAAGEKLRLVDEWVVFSGKLGHEVLSFGL